MCWASFCFPVFTHFILTMRINNSDALLLTPEVLSETHLQMKKPTHKEDRYLAPPGASQEQNPGGPALNWPFSHLAPPLPLPMN